MNNELTLAGAGIMFGAGMPIAYRRKYDSWHMGLFYFGFILALIGVFL